MKYYRFMSVEEYNKVINHWDMTSTTEFGANYRTDSVGFCFIREDLSVLSSQGYEITIEKMYSFLMGIVSSSMLVEFEAADDTLFKQGYGVYADPFGRWEDTIVIDEYSTTFYNDEILKPVRATFVDDANEFKMISGSDWFPV